MFCIVLLFKLRSVGKTRRKQSQIAQNAFLVSAVPATPSAAGFGRSLGGQQDPDESHSCSTLGVNWVPGPQDRGRDEERSRRKIPIHFGRRQKGS